MEKSKKGELTSSQIVIIAVLVISFVIILLLLRIYYWSPIINQEACHESIVFRSSVNFGFLQANRIVPLKCQTEKKCMSLSGGDCAQVGKNSKDNLVEKTKLNSDKEKARQQILDQMVEAMYDCHSMLGEGKLAFMPNSVFKENYCLICTRFVLDERARQEIGDITYAELYQKLANKKTPGGKTYLEYLYPGWKNWRNYARLVQALKENNINNGDGSLANLKPEDWKMDLSEEGGYAIIAQIAPVGYSESIVKTALVSAAVTTGVIIAATGVGAPVGITLIGTVAAGGAAGGATFWYASPTGKFDNLERLQSMKCTSFETAP